MRNQQTNQQMPNRKPQQVGQMSNLQGGAINTASDARPMTSNRPAG